MKTSVISILIIIAVLSACQKNNDVQTADINDLKGNWRIIAQRSGPDTLHPQGIWADVNFSKQNADYDLYCINDSRVGQSFISTVNCAYQDGAGSYVGVFTSDCAHTVYARDTVWSQLVNFDISLKDANSFEFLEQYNLSKRVNIINQHCNPIPYMPAYSTKNERIASWVFDEAAQIITVDYGAAFSPFDGEKINRYKVVSFTGKEVVLRLQASYFTELRLSKL